MMTSRRYINTSTYEYHNENPKGRVGASDCVFRAVAFALGITWEQAVRDLTEIGIKMACAPNEVKAVEKYLKGMGIEKKKQPKTYEYDKVKKVVIRDFAEAHKKSNIKYLISLAGHMTVVYKGKVYDTWNCGGYTIGNYWEIKGE